MTPRHPHPPHPIAPLSLRRPRPLIIRGHTLHSRLLALAVVKIDLKAASVTLLDAAPTVEQLLHMAKGVCATIVWRNEAEALVVPRLHDTMLIHADGTETNNERILLLLATNVEATKAHECKVFKKGSEEGKRISLS